jgi:hypothetical protein
MERSSQLRRVKTEAFSTRFFQATSLFGYFLLARQDKSDSLCKAKPVGWAEESAAVDAE